jgi:hypothetical protein
MKEWKEVEARSDNNNNNCNNNGKIFFRVLPSSAGGSALIPGCETKLSEDAAKRVRAFFVKKGSIRPSVCFTLNFNPQPYST